MTRLQAAILIIVATVALVFTITVEAGAGERTAVRDVAEVVLHAHVRKVACRRHDCHAHYSTRLRVCRGYFTVERTSTNLAPDYADAGPTYLVTQYFERCHWRVRRDG